MSIKDNGGPAFPTNTENYSANWSDTGMSLREYAAIKAMQALIIAMPHMHGAVNEKGAPPSEGDIARQAFIFADAMLEQGKK